MSDAPRTSALTAAHSAGKLSDGRAANMVEGYKELGHLCYQLERELDEARAVISEVTNERDRLAEQSWTQACAHCGAVDDGPGASDRMRAHAMACPKNAVASYAELLERAARAMVHWYDYIVEGAAPGSENAGSVVALARAALANPINAGGAISKSGDREVTDQPGETPGAAGTCTNPNPAGPSTEASVGESPSVKPEASGAGGAGTECVHQVNRWIPVTERLPEDDRRVLARNSVGYCACVTSIFPTPEGFDGEDATPERTDYPIGDITHWMPIPDFEFVAGKKPPERVNCGKCDHPMGCESECRIKAACDSQSAIGKKS